MTFFYLNIMMIRPPATIYSSVEECCGRLDWIDLDSCVATSSGNSGSSPQWSNQFYVDFAGDKCAKECDPDDGLPCMGKPTVAAPEYFGSVRACCDEAFHWKRTDLCIDQTYGRDRRNLRESMTPATSL